MTTVMLWMFACTSGGEKVGETDDNVELPTRTGSGTNPLVDADGDGFPADTDCNDHDDTVFPGADELWYDGIDQACNGGSDYDQDGDGVDHPEDCNDQDALVFPDAVEVWYDGTDQDCSTGSDFDQDGDGYDVDVDCEDQRPAAYPGAEEVWYDGIDGNCDELSDYDADGDGDDLEGFGGTDCDDADPAVSGLDTDGDGSSACAGDCAGDDPSTYPGAVDDSCDGIDQDCAGGDHTCGAVYVESLENFDWIEPGAMDLLLGLVDLTDVGIEVVEIDPVTEVLSTVVALAPSGFPFEPNCTAAVAAPSDYSHAPTFQIGPTPFKLDISGVFVDVEDFMLRGTVASDASELSDIVLTGLVDTRPLAALLGDVCELVALFGDDCVPCADGEVVCILGEATLAHMPVESGADIDSVCGL